MVGGSEDDEEDDLNQEGQDKYSNNTYKSQKSKRSKLSSTSNISYKIRKQHRTKQGSSGLRSGIQPIIVKAIREVMMPEGTPMTTNQGDGPTNSDGQSKPSNTENERSANNEYGTNDPGPFYVYIEHKSRESVHPMSIGKAIYQSNFTLKNEIKEIKKVGYSRIRVESNDYKTANLLKNLDIIKQKDLQAYIPNYFTQRQGVVRNVDPNEDESDLLDAIKCSAKVLSIRRMTKRVHKTDNEYEIEKLGTCVITFQGQILPEYVYIWSTCCPVTPYVYPVMQCFRCLRLGHKGKQCKGIERCRNCGNEHATKDCTNNDKLFCVLCKNEGHSSTHKSCPEYLKAKEIKINMAYMGMSYEDSKNTCFNNITYANAVKNKVENNKSQFPSLLGTQQNQQKHHKFTQIRQVQPKINGHGRAYEPPPQEFFYRANNSHSSPVYETQPNYQSNSNYLSHNIIEKLIKNTVFDIISQVMSENKILSDEEIKIMIDKRINVVNANNLGKNNNGF